MGKTRLVVIEKRISQCYNECPYFTVEGMERIMVCSNPRLEEQEDPEKDPDPYRGWFITHANSIGGFPDECPLALNESWEDLEV